MIHDLTTQEGRNKYVEEVAKNTPQLVKDHNSEVVERLNSMLTDEEIVNHLMSDIVSYEETIKSILKIGLENSRGEKIYLDAWFRGAEGKDLEDSERGIIYKKN